MEQAERPTVDVIASHNVVARVEQMEQRVFSGHAARESQTKASAVERCQARLERRARWVGRARIVEALVHPDLALGVRAGLINRHDDRARGRVRRLAYVNCPGRKTLGKIKIRA